MGEARGASGRLTTEGKAIDAVFFDIRDTLGVVDRKGHLVKYKPSTDQLLEAMQDVVGLRIGLITNLPADVTADEGKRMVDEAGLGEFLDPSGFVTNKAGVDKPAPEIYALAARQIGVPIDRCLFVGENLIEVIGAKAAGMHAVLKPFPPGREFLLKPVKPQAPTDKNSGRLVEAVLEEEHLVGKRIVIAGAKIRDRVAAGPPDAATLRAMGMLSWLTDNFIDPFHHRKEEEVLLPFAQMRGVPAEDCAFVAPEHEQGRLYFRGMRTALQRLRMGDATALVDFSHCLSGFIDLYKAHGAKEDDILFKRLGDRLTDADDALMIDLMGRIGPSDLTLYLTLIADLESALAA
jgi:hemerythrin-like domain-containing protein/beta-phosphoglucomutase-like phosphatase (HAD superfamily)